MLHGEVWNVLEKKIFIKKKENRIIVLLKNLNKIKYSFYKLF